MAQKLQRLAEQLCDIIQHLLGSWLMFGDKKTNSVKLLFQTVIVPKLSLCFLSLCLTLPHIGNNGMQILKSESDVSNKCCWFLV